MSANQENIEARLCAYIDGMLNPAERAQLEKTLDSHEEYRQLLAEIGQMRDLLRDLPRERAPADMNEAVQAQLERGALLDLDAAERDIVRFNYWPHLMSIAAVVALAIGLALVIFFAMPHGPRQVALGPEGGATTGMPSSGHAVDDGSGYPIDRTPAPLWGGGTLHPTGGMTLKGGGGTALHREVESEGLDAKNAPLPSIASTPTVTLAPTIVGSGAPEHATLNVTMGMGRDESRSLANAEDVRSLQEKLGTRDAPANVDQLAQAAENAPLVVVVKASDVNQASTNVSRYLIENGIAAQAIPEESIRPTRAGEPGLVIGNNTLSLNDGTINGNINGNGSLGTTGLGGVSGGVVNFGGGNAGTGNVALNTNTNTNTGPQPINNSGTIANNTTIANNVNASRPNTNLPENDPGLLDINKNGAYANGRAAPAPAASSSPGWAEQKQVAQSEGARPQRPAPAPEAAKLEDTDAAAAMSKKLASDVEHPQQRGAGQEANRDAGKLGEAQNTNPDSTTAFKGTLNNGATQQSPLGSANGYSTVAGGTVTQGINSESSGNAVQTIPSGRRMILARMNARQAQVMSERLSRQQGQQAECIREPAPTAATPEPRENPDPNYGLSKDPKLDRQRALDDVHKHAKAQEAPALQPATTAAPSADVLTTGGVVAPAPTASAPGALVPAAPSPMSPAPTDPTAERAVDVLILINQALNPAESTVSPATQPTPSEATPQRVLPYK